MVSLLALPRCTFVARKGCTVVGTTVGRMLGKVTRWKTDGVGLVDANFPFTTYLLLVWFVCACIGRERSVVRSPLRLAVGH